MRARSSVFRVLVATVLLAGVAVVVDPVGASAATIPDPPANAAICDPPSGTPVMTSLARTPTRVDVRTHSAKVTLTVRAHDSANAITTVLVGLHSPAVFGHLRTREATLKLVSGTSRSGVWRGTVVIPRWTNGGNWSISVFLHEAKYHEVDDPDTRSQPDLSEASILSWVGAALYTPLGKGGGETKFASGWPTSVTVSSHADVTRPVISALTLSPRHVNTSAGPHKVTIKVRASDNLSGVAKIRIQARPVTQTHPYAPVQSTGGVLVRQSGTAHKGVFVGSLTVPAWTGKQAHTWTLTLTANDVAGNSLELLGSQLAALHLPSTLVVSGKTDTTKPVLTGLALGPAVNATQADAPFGMTVHASDAQSGIRTVSAEVVTPSGLSAYAVHFTRTATGAWHGSVVIPRCSEPGNWTIISVTVTDGTGNLMNYGVGGLGTLHLPTTFSVQALDVEPPRFSVPTTVSHLGPIVVTFDKPVLWQGSGSPFFIHAPTLAEHVDGTWTCKNASNTTVDCNADDADVTQASFALSAPLVVGNRYAIGTNDGLYSSLGYGPAMNAYVRFTAT